MEDSLIFENLNESSQTIEYGHKKPFYKRWYMILLYVILSLIAVLGFTLGMFIIFAEYSQCDRSCRLEFCNGKNDSACLLDRSISGRRKKPHLRSKCICTAPKLFNGTVEINRMAKPTDTWKVDSEEKRYCAVPPNSTDFLGITYDSKEDALAADAILLHLGPCGMCSSISDKEAYNKTAQTLTKISLKAAFGSILSADLARKQMAKSGLSDKCVDCWIGNMRQTIIHCFGVCMTSSRSSCDKNGELTKCLYCDEVHSGMYFRRCAGMTRRRAGIETDICRKPGEIVD
ncbi:hypothetical protein TRFO_09572 [Tritrichomonas foetus]|uniref:Uncharacterized protein n=1 Tax=Tritrichomonas foetus TaxID=1144522 RepID=A0A1J4JDW1_9EUKA|nr:hypothetical protein TRFO_09572 [Tritrichomonas foetus]|eukprot:OHS97288.1 hypothetical protein TRFO_09572 [Tritrichomonas foetus]